LVTNLLEISYKIKLILTSGKFDNFDIVTKLAYLYDLTA